MDYNLLDLNQIVRSWGRGVVMYAPKWNPIGPLNLTHLGDTEGDISIATNPELALLTVPELTGPAGHEVDYTGENPTVEIPLYVTSPAMHALIGPTGQASAGRSRRSAPVEYTIAIFPEGLFLVPDGDGIVQSETLTFAAGVWTLGGNPLSTDQETLLDSAFWLWRAVFSRPPRTFHGGAGDARKNIETVTVQGLHHPDMPEGHHLYTTGDPADSGINLEGTS